MKQLPWQLAARKLTYLWPRLHLPLSASASQHFRLLEQSPLRNFFARSLCSTSMLWNSTLCTLCIRQSAACWRPPRVVLTNAAYYHQTIDSFRFSFHWSSTLTILLPPNPNPISLPSQYETTINQILIKPILVSINDPASKSTVVVRQYLLLLHKHPKSCLH